MRIENVKVYDLEESVRAAKYPMAVDIDKCTSEITEMTKKLAQSPKGEAHDQFLSGIRVAFDLTCTNKMWVELERYRFITFVSSQSTMHRIAKFDLHEQFNQYVDPKIREIMEELKNVYLHTKDEHDYLRLLYSNPAGFELTARLTTNYRCLKGVFVQRREHRLPEWREFCKWIKTLPHATELIVGEK